MPAIFTWCYLPYRSPLSVTESLLGACSITRLQRLIGVLWYRAAETQVAELDVRGAARSGRMSPD